ncbi:UNVERIFIED_CONTAM: zinc finger protein [Trichonephila clavipes]
MLLRSGTFQKHNFRFSYISGKPKKIHQCTFCDYITYKTDHLRNHILTHTGEKPFQCALCDKCFKTKSNLQVHFKVHDRTSQFHVSVA